MVGLVRKECRRGPKSSELARGILPKPESSLDSVKGRSCSVDNEKSSISWMWMMML